MDGWGSFAAVALIALIAGLLWANRQFPLPLAALFVGAILLRIAGTLARQYVLVEVYSGSGDAPGYFGAGQRIADGLVRLDFTVLVGQSGNWWSTPFVRTVAGLVILLTGNSYHAACLVFALFAFGGVVLCGRAFGAVYGADAERHYASWLWIWPSLWYWPSTIGKEALMLLAAGIAVYGYVTGDGARKWLLISAGVGLAACVRPHVAGVIAAAIAIAEFARPGHVLRAQRLASLCLAGLIAVAMINVGLRQMDLGDADFEEVRDFYAYRSRLTATGGSRIAQVDGVAAAPVGLVTILMRPFPWEASGMAAFSAIEIALLWMVVFMRRREAWAVLRTWRASAFTRFGLPFTLAMALLYGLAFANLGIIARQRVVILPYLLLLAASPALVRPGTDEAIERPLRLVDDPA